MTDLILNDIIKTTKGKTKKGKGKKMKWSIWYKHTFTGDTFEGTYEEAEQFGIKNIKEYLEEENISLPVVVNNCGKKETCATYKDFIEDIEEFYNEDEEEIEE